MTAEGPVSRGDIDGLLDAVTGAKALPYRKLVDATAGKFAMGALVLPGRLPRDDEPEDAPTLVARLIGIVASAKRPLRLFTCSRA